MLKRILVQAGTDQPVAIRLRKVGTESATSVTVTTATNIVLIGSTTTDTITFATYTDVGSVADAINATGRWEAKVLDCLRSHASASKLLDGAITSGIDGRGNVVWDVLVDSSTSLFLAAALSAHRDFDAPNGHRVHVLELRYSVDMGTAAANSAQVFARKGSNERTVWSALSVDTTDTTISWASGVAGITGDNEEDLIFKVKDAATLADAAANFVRISGLLE